MNTPERILCFITIHQILFSNRFNVQDSNWHHENLIQKYTHKLKDRVYKLDNRGLLLHIHY